MRIDRLLVDMGYKPGIVADVKRKVGGTAVKAAGETVASRPRKRYTQEDLQRKG